MSVASEPSAGRIAFLRLTSGYWQVWEMAPDGSGQRQLTRTPVDKVHMAWRPGTNKLLYHTNQGATFLLDPATGAEERLLEGLTVTDANWSPDGKKLAYGLGPSELTRGKTSLWMSAPDGSDRRQVAGSSEIDALAPTWLRDGRTILYRQCIVASYMEVTHDFWTVKADEENSNCPVTRDDEPLKFDQTASGEGVIAYSSHRTGFYEVWTHAPGIGTPRQLTKLRSYAGNPTWSEDGGSLAFDSNKDGSLQIYRIRSDGRELVRLTSDAPSRKPVWVATPTKVSAHDLCALSPTLTKEEAARRGPTESTKTPALSIAWVSLDPPSFDPAKGENATLRFRISQAARLDVRFINADGGAVRTLTTPSAAAGEQQVTWDGRDDAGQFVPPDAYAYTITATAPGSTPVTYDLRDRTGGEPAWPRDTTVDAKGHRITYTLAEASRVRMMVSRSDTTLPIAVLTDWEPRQAGQREEPWDGWDPDHVINAFDGSPLTPIYYAFALPKNTVIVTGQANAASGQSVPSSISRLTSPLTDTSHASGRSLHLHARHPRSLCYSPRLTLSWPGVATNSADGLPRVTGPTALRIEPAAVQPAGRQVPIPRLSVFVYVDGRMVERCLSGYVPYQWRLDPERFSPGAHVVTALLVWRDDHAGIAHTRVWVEPVSPSRDTAN
jgi:FlgD Ig-like domain/WD40-like Beta Propeller Repeat